MWTGEQRIRTEDVYISILKRKRIFQEDGWERMEEVPQALRPSGCLVLDAVVECLAKKKIYSDRAVAAALKVPVRDLTAVLRVLTGYTTQGFINAYRLLAAEEYLRCTALSLEEIVARLGWSSRYTFSLLFRKRFGISPVSYRRRKRPNDYQYRYGWE